MNFGTLQSRISEQLEDRTDLTVKIKNWINDTRKDLATEYDFDYLYVESTCETSAGSAEYSLPADYLDIEDIWIGKKKLVRLYVRERDVLSETDIDASVESFALPVEGGLSDSKQGPPDYYIIRGQEIELWPIPDSTYTLKFKYFGQPGDFSSDSESDYISKFHFDAIIWGAALRGAHYLDDGDKIVKFESKYDKAIKKMMAKEKHRASRDQHPRMKSYKDFYLGTFKRMFRVYSEGD